MWRGIQPFAGIVWRCAVPRNSLEMLVHNCVEGYWRSSGAQALGEQRP